MFQKIDNFILHQYDKFILFIWNRFHLHRSTYLRAIFVCWIVTGVSYCLKSHSWYLVVVYGIIMAMQGFEDHLTKSFDTTIQNARTLVIREIGFYKFLRHVMYFTFIYSFIKIPFIDHTNLFLMILNEVVLTFATLKLIGDYTLEPNEPPKRKKKEPKLVLQPIKLKG